MKLHVICVAYERPIHLRILIDSFLVQSNPNWELTIVHDGKASQEVKNTLKLYKGDHRIFYTESKERYGKYGHPNRRTVLQQLEGNPKDYVLITNDDNYYVPYFVEYFLRVCGNDVGMVYCDTVTRLAYPADQVTRDYAILFTKIKRGCIDMGSFIVRMDIAQKNGFNHDVWEADGLYAEECNAKRAEAGLRAVYITKPLFVHN